MVNKLCYVAHRTCVGQGTYPTDGRYTLIETTMIQSSYLAIGELYSVVSNPADDTCKVCLAADEIFKKVLTSPRISCRMYPQ